MMGRLRLQDGNDERYWNKKAVLDLAGKEVRDKDWTGRNSLGTFLALVVVVVVAATSILCKHIKIIFRNQSENILECSAIRYFH